MKRDIQEVQAELLVLAKKMHAFCKAYDIRYSIHGGTMLGAVREKGFISWDDDMDVSFTREEYQRFEKAFSAAPAEGVVLNRDKLYPRLLMRREGHPVVWIDIFIYDYITANRFARKRKIAKLKYYNLLCRNPELLTLTRQNSKHNPLRYAVISAIVKHGNRKDRNRLLQKAGRVMQSCPGDRTWIHRSNDTIAGMPMILPAYVMDRYEEIPFEDTELMISSCWDEILTVSYGADYMTPRKTETDAAREIFVEAEARNADREYDR